MPGIQGVVYGIAIIAIILCGARRRLLARARPPGTAASRRPAAPLPDLRGRRRSYAAAASRRAEPAPTSSCCATSASRSAGCRALDGIDLAVPEGGLYGIIGPNGAGKTTLFNVINGFLAPDSAARSALPATPIVGLRPNRVCRHGIGRTFQVVRAFPRMTVLENVMVGAFVGAADDATARRMALAALDRVGLSARADAVAGGLTTRELRLMELARALAPHPRLLLLDETLAGLGHDDLDGILAVIRQVRADGVTVADHRAYDAGDGAAGRPFHVLDHGRLIASGPARRRRARPRA